MPQDNDVGRKPNPAGGPSVGATEAPISPSGLEQPVSSKAEEVQAASIQAARGYQEPPGFGDAHPELEAIRSPIETPADMRDRPPGEYHGQPYGGRTQEPRSWWDKTRDRVGAMLGDREARLRLEGRAAPAPGEYDARRDDTGWNDPLHADNNQTDAGRPDERR